MKAAFAFVVLCLAAGFLLPPGLSPVSNASPLPAPQAPSMVYCASDGGGRNFCRANTMQGVRIIRQRSDADCVYNRSWGFDRAQIWVDRGCRADFALGGRY